MSAGYVLDPRSAADVRRRVRVAADRALLPIDEDPAPTWASLLFDGDELAPAGEPSRALLAGLVELHVGLAAHLNTVPGRFLAEWLRERLGIATLPAVPDRVVVAATADPARAPVAVPAGSLLRAKDSDGVDRRYATTESLTVHGIEMIDVRAYRAGSGTAGIVDTAVSRGEGDQPFVPFPTAPPAVHAFAVVSDLLAFEGGDMVVRLTFTGGDARLLDGATWEYPSPEGPSTAERLRSSTTEIDLGLSVGCVPGDALGAPARYLRASFPGGVPASALSFSFTAMSIRVLHRPALAPDGGFYNDGRLDVTKEFQPFGPAARRGDAFYVRSDEAFTKPLNRLVVRLQLLGPTGSVRAVVYGDLPAWKVDAAHAYGDSIRDRIGTGEREVLDELLDLFESETHPRIDWQHYDGTSWQPLGTTEGELATFAWTGGGVGTGPLSEPFDLGGEGRFVRAFLAEGDFGWTDYLERVASFAAAAAGSGTPNASDLIPPDPPIVSSITLEYATRDVDAETVSVDGWAMRRRGGGVPHFPFAVPLDVSGGDAGMVAFGLRLGPAALGTSVSLYLDVESAAACGSDGPSSLRWEYWTGAEGWLPLDVADGTLGLRQAGVIRFVAPVDWAEGSEDVSALEGRWFRAVTDAPGRVGTLLSIVPDAVEAVHRATETSGAFATPLEPKQVKGLLVPVPGIKKLTNDLAGIAGRAAEELDSPGYLQRAAGVARHRGRSIQIWDYEELVRVGFPEIAVVRCLPHTNAAGESEPGSVGLVVIPRSHDPMPLPSVSLAERIRRHLAPALPVHARPTVLCPLYVPVTVSAEIVLVPGAPAVDARRRITDQLERFLHPTAHDPVRFGRELFASSIAAFLESLGDVDHLESFVLAGPDGPAERVTVNACRGLVASSGAHALVLEEQL